MPNSYLRLSFVFLSVLFYPILNIQFPSSKSPRNRLQRFLGNKTMLRISFQSGLEPRLKRRSPPTFATLRGGGYLLFYYNTLKFLFGQPANLYFGIKTIWYWHFHAVCDKLFLVHLDFLLSILSLACDTIHIIR